MKLACMEDGKVTSRHLGQKRSQAKVGRTITWAELRRLIKETTAVKKRGKRVYCSVREKQLQFGNTTVKEYEGRCAKGGRIKGGKRRRRGAPLI